MGVSTTVTASYMLFLASISHGKTSSVYGFSELNCGDTHTPTSCAVGATTATGDAFDPAKPTAAIPLPANRRLRKGFHIYLRHTAEGPCVPIYVNDKMNARFRGSHNFDLTPAAVYAITGKYPTKYWSSKEVQICHFIPLHAPSVELISTNFVSRSLSSIMWTVPTATRMLFAAQ
jgi:hypothetical protein